MNTIHPLLAAAIASLLVACSASDPSAQATAPAQTPGSGNTVEKHASATGTITAIDPVAKSITIDHGPVPALEWPAMTMTFQAGTVDLGRFNVGDPVAFEFSASGMTATITTLTRE